MNGKTQTIAQWAREYNIAYEKLRRRLSTGVPIKLALTLHNSFKRGREYYERCRAIEEANVTNMGS